MGIQVLRLKAKVIQEEQLRNLITQFKYPDFSVVYISILYSLLTWMVS
jgi:hypothetical protein